MRTLTYWPAFIFFQADVKHTYNLLPKSNIRACRHNNCTVALTLTSQALCALHKVSNQDFPCGMWPYGHIMPRLAELLLWINGQHNYYNNTLLINMHNLEVVFNAISKRKGRVSKQINSDNTFNFGCVQCLSRAFDFMVVALYLLLFYIHAVVVNIVYYIILWLYIS